MKKVYYFAYGSNILQERLEQRVGEVKKISNYRLHGYKLAFDTGCNFAIGTYANIIAGTSEDFIEGVLYEITGKQLKRLDEYEMLYLKQFFDAPDGSIAVVYVNDEPLNKEKGIPQLYYLNIIMQGCANQGLNYTLNLLQNFKKENYKLKSYKKFIPNEKV